MHRLIRLICAGCAALLFTGAVCLAQEKVPEPTSFPFDGEINQDGANVRLDSTVGAQSICTMARTEPVEVVAQQYDWYKIRLPKHAPAFVKKNLVAPVDDKTVKVLRSNVNIRFGPSETTAILGKASKDEIMIVTGDSGEWFQVEPPGMAYGYINKKLVLPFRTGMAPAAGPRKAERKHVEQPAAAGKTETPPPDDLAKDEIATIGIVEPYGKVINREATHKLTSTAEGTIFLLKATRSSLDALNYRKVKITGKLIEPPRPRHYPVIEVRKLELLD